MDANIWHLSHEGSDLEDPWNEPKDDLYMICKTPEAAPDKPCYFTIEFEQGIPVSIDGQKYGPVELITKLNELGAENGAQQREKRISFRRAMKQSIGRTMKAGAKGIKIMCSGRLGGAEIARVE